MSKQLNIAYMGGVNGNKEVSTNLNWGSPVRNLVKFSREFILAITIPVKDRKGNRKRHTL